MCVHIYVYNMYLQMYAHIAQDYACLFVHAIAGSCPRAEEKPAVLRNGGACEPTPAPQFPEKPARPKEAEINKPSSQPEAQSAPQAG